MQKAMTLLLCAAAAGASSTAVLAQQGRGADEARPTILVGELVGARKVRPTQSARTEHRLLQLRTQQGQLVVVDIGEVGASAALTGLQRGDRVIAIGRRAGSRERPVLIATSVGELHAVRPAARAGTRGGPRDPLVRRSRLQQAETDDAEADDIAADEAEPLRW